MEKIMETKVSSDESKSVELGDVADSLKEIGCGNYGRSHYRRRCKIRAPCCNEVFDYRHCHNEAKNSPDTDPLDHHDIPRHEVKKVICSLCDTEQDVQQYCLNCGVCMGKYFCGGCKFFDENGLKKQYNCDECGTCGTGGKENFFHCKKCGCCYSKSMKDTHRCVQRAMHHNCPVCLEYSCPVCSKSIGNMTPLWEKLDQEIASTPVPAIFQNKMVWILCNDCGVNSHVDFHPLVHKCLNCNSYNTRQTRGGPATSCPSVMPELV